MTTPRKHPPAVPTSQPSNQTGQAGRRALLVTAGIAAAGTGAWWAWRRQEGGTHATPDRPAAAETETGTGTGTGTKTEPASHPAHGGHAATAQPPLVQGDTLTNAFWEQSFDTPQGTALSLASLKGKPLLLNFWATWCPPCVKEMPELDRFGRDFSPQGWRVLGLAIDGPTPVKAFLAKVRVGFAIGLAGFEGTELSQALGNTSGGLPFTVLIDAQGRIHHRKMGATSHEELARWANGMKAP